MGQSVSSGSAAGYEARTARNGGSELLIFAPPAKTRSHTSDGLSWV